MLSSSTGGQKTVDHDIKIPLDLYQGLGRFFDLLKIRIIDEAVARAAVISPDSKPTSVCVEDLIHAAEVVLPEAATRLSVSLRRIGSEDAKRKAS